ncbi:MAG: diaminopimelate epimerase [Pseudomonadales bacterium]|nr:diaminopimelate epimerase [Pseudomonadales bacterium]
MQGLGNDFMVIDRISHPVELTPAQIRQLADRHFGVGFDQLLLVDPPTTADADFNYRIFNADGSEVEHCGNGARCFARFVLDKGLAVRTPIRVRTSNRLLELAIESGGVRVDMGEPDFDPAALPFAAEAAKRYTLDVCFNGENRRQEFFAVSVGNPHIVLLVDDVETAPVQALGAVLLAHPTFPQGVNVGFMQCLDRRTIRLRVYERGVGETIACGTGACAAVACGIAAGLLDQQVDVQLRGGSLMISWAGPGQSIMMCGPATTVFEGNVELIRGNP